MSVSGIIDQSENILTAPIARAGTLTIEQDAQTPSGDPVQVTIKDLGLNILSTLAVDNGATATVVNLLDPTALSEFRIGNNATLNLVDHNNARFAALFDLSGSNATVDIGAAVKISPNNFIADASATNTIELLGTTAAYGKWFQFSGIDAGSLHLYDSSHHYLRALYFEGTHSSHDFTVTDNAGGTAIAEVANNAGAVGHIASFHNTSPLAELGHFAHYL